MLYEIRVRPNCDPESCHVLRSTFFSFFFLPSSSPSCSHSSTLLLSLAQLSLSGTFFRCGKRKCNKRSRQLALAKMNVIHSFTHSFIHSLSLAFVVVASLCILRMQLSLESGSIVRSCTPSPSLSLPSLPRFTCANRSS